MTEPRSAALYGESVTAPGLNVDEMRLWRAFIECSGRVQQHLDASLKAHSDLTLGDYDVLVHLSEAPGRRLRMSDLSGLLVHSQSRLTQRIDRMVARGLVAREKSTEDGRVTYAVITDTGFAEIEAAAPQHLVEVRKVMVDLVDPDELPAVIAALERIVSAARSDASSGISILP